MLQRDTSSKRRWIARRPRREVDDEQGDGQNNPPRPSNARAVLHASK
jgi:hypothetical protein